MKLLEKYIHIEIIKIYHRKTWIVRKNNLDYWFLSILLIIYVGNIYKNINIYFLKLVFEK